MYIASRQRYDNMRYNRCGKSGVLLPAISLGLWQNFGWASPYESSREMILGAFDMGITHFDAANNYGPPAGAGEETFGRVLKNDLRPYRDELIISTKAGFYMWEGPYGEWGSKKNLVASLDQSLRRLGLDYVDIFYHHRPDPSTPLEETMDALAGIVKSGKALYVGISNYPTRESARAVAMLKAMGVRLLIHQPRYSMLDRHIETGLLSLLEENGVGCIAFSPLAQGRLTDKYFSGIPKNSRAVKSAFLKEKDITAEVVGRAKRLNEIAVQRGQSLAQMALSWALRDSRVTSLVIGASSIGQIEENLGALENLSFTSEELSSIDNILN